MIRRARIKRGGTGCLICFLRGKKGGGGLFVSHFVRPLLFFSFLLFFFFSFSLFLYLRKGERDKSWESR